MSWDHPCNQRNGGSTGIRNWLEIILLILIGLTIFIIAYQAISHREKSHAVKFGHVLTSGERTKLLLNIY